MHIWTPGLSCLTHVLPGLPSRENSEPVPGLPSPATLGLHLIVSSSPRPLCGITLHSCRGPFRSLRLPFELGLLIHCPGWGVTHFLQSLRRPQRTSRWFPTARQVLGAALSCLPHSPPTLPAFLGGKGHCHSQVPPGTVGVRQGNRRRQSPASLSGRVFTGEGQ